MQRWLGILVVLSLAGPATADFVLPPGFRAEVYVSAEGFDPNAERGAPGIPSASTMAFDDAGNLYVARTGARFTGGDVEDMWRVYRFPPGGARVTARSEERYHHGPPLRNPTIAGVRGGRDLFVSTHDRDRKIGVLYRVADGRALLFTGGTPPRGTPPLLRQPEAVAFDAGGHLYVADREEGTIARFDPSGKLVDPRYASVLRPRLLAIDGDGSLWIGSDGNATAPWQDGPGGIWRVGPDGALVRLAEVLPPAGMSLGPGGVLFVGQRRSAQIVAVTPEGTRIEFATATEGTAPRGLAFAPDTPETRRAGIAGDLFVITIRRQAWQVNDVVRISGPFEEFVRQRRKVP